MSEFVRVWCVLETTPPASASSVGGIFHEDWHPFTLSFALGCFLAIQRDKRLGVIRQIKQSEACEPDTENRPRKAEEKRLGIAVRRNDDERNKKKQEGGRGKSLGDERERRRRRRRRKTTTRRDEAERANSLISSADLRRQEGSACPGVCLGGCLSASFTGAAAAAPVSRSVDRSTGRPAGRMSVRTNGAKKITKGSASESPPASGE